MPQHPPQFLAAQQQQQMMMPMSMEQAASYGAMPLYYPEQGGLEYGYPPQVAFGGPQPGYFYPPQFPGYPPAAAAGQFGGFAPQPYYPPVAAPPPPPQQPQQPLAPVEHPISAVSPPPAAVSPESLQQAPSVPSSSTSPQPAEVVPAPAEASPEAAPVEAAAPVSAETAVPAAAVPPAASLHTFFQTGPPAPGMPPAMVATNGAPFPKGTQRGPMGPRRSIGGPNGLPNGGGAGKRAAFGGARPPCSFFEANRCRHGDKCLFAHLLPDGSDARALGRGMIGIDGRTEHPEATGGMPPAWLATQKAMKVANQTARKQLEQGAILNGGYSYRERMTSQAAPPQGAAPSQQQQQQSHAQPAQGAPHQAQGEQQDAAPAAAPAQAGPNVQAPNAAPAPANVAAAPQQQQQQQQRIPNAAAQRNGVLPPGSAAPQLVAAINGLTRRIPPAHANNKQGPAGQKQNGQQQQNGPKQQQQQQHSKPQRIPSGENDFPALSPAAPSSPVIEKEGFAAALAAPVPAPAAAAPAAASEPVADKPAATEANKPTSPSSESEGFVMVSHADAGVAADATEEKKPAEEGAPAAAASAAPRPKLIGGWASAAARGASVAVPEKPKTRAFSPVVANRSAEAKEAAAAPAKAEKDEHKSAPAPAKKEAVREREKVDEDGFVRQQPKRKGGAHKAGKAALQHQPVVLKA